MKKLIFILPCFFLACGSNPNNWGSKTVTPYIEAVKAEDGINIDLPYTIADALPPSDEGQDPASTAGYYVPGNHFVLINIALWNLYSDTTKKVLIIHEYGHSIGLGHNDTLKHDNELNMDYPESIMHPSATMYINDQIWAKYKDQLLEPIRIQEKIKY